MLVSTGKYLRLPFLYERKSPIVIAPIDDYLIFGPRNGLENPSEFLQKISRAEPDAILTHAGIVNKFPEYFAKVRCIINLSASTTISEHSYKKDIHGIETALRLNAHGVAYHVNIGSKYSSEMIEHASRLVELAARYDMPVLGIVYPRDDEPDSDAEFAMLKASDPISFSNKVAHCVSVAVSIGFDIIKTWYTGNKETFIPSVQASAGIPIVIAGGPLMSEDQAFTLAETALSSGASGVSFGRNLFGRDNPMSIVQKIRSIRFQ